MKTVLMDSLTEFRFTIPLDIRYKTLFPATLLTSTEKIKIKAGRKKTYKQHNKPRLTKLRNHH